MTFPAADDEISTDPVTAQFHRNRLEKEGHGDDEPAAAPARDRAGLHAHHSTPALRWPRVDKGHVPLSGGSVGRANS